MTYIKLHPEEWDQSMWACETTACLAGTAVMLDREITHLQLDLLDSADHGVLYEEGKRILGFDMIQAQEIFYSTIQTSYERFEALVSEVTGVKFKNGEEI